ncbi:hypothetical protein FWC31_01135 [Candidatus Saccharibacteria bacterium]|nr:hypothetical protein [Candidatus Saccharibacteria bacterium]
MMNGADEYVKNQLLLNREAFRAENTECLRMFTKKDRTICWNLSIASGVSIDEFSQIFCDEVMPAIKALEAKRDNKTLRTCLIKNFDFSGLGVDAAVDYLIATCRNRIITNFITKIGGQQNENKLRDLLDRPIDELADLFERYHNYHQALEISKKYNLALVDPQTSWFKQRKMQKKIRRDQRATMHREKKRLRQIEHDITNLFNNDRLLLDIVDKNWSFVEILDLDRQYRRRLDETKKISPITKAEIFEEVTAKFRHHNTEVLAAGKDNLSLKELRVLGENVYNLLLEVFDMDNTERNQLMNEIRTYSGLINEREQLLLAHRNRVEFLGL